MQQKLIELNFWPQLMLYFEIVHRWLDKVKFDFLDISHVCFHTCGQTGNHQASDYSASHSTAGVVCLVSVPAHNRQIHTHTLCMCAILKFMGQCLYCVPADTHYHSESLDLPKENCLGAHRAVSSSTSTPKSAPGKRLREHLYKRVTTETGMLPECYNLWWSQGGMNEPRHLFLGTVQK